MKTVLLPTDFSGNSLNAIFYAIALFGRSRIKFILFHAYKIPPVTIEEYVTEIPDFAAQSEDGLKKVIRKIDKKFPGHPFKFEILSKLGDPIDIMKKIIRNKKVDLTIMGTKGASGIKSVLMGSVTSKAIKKITSPVLAVPEKANYSTIKNIAFAYDLKKLEDEKILYPLVYFSQKNKSEIIVLHISKNTKKLAVENNNRSHFIKSLRRIPHSFYLLEEENAVKGIENFIESRDIDLLAMVSRKHSLTERLFSRSVTRRLSMHTRIPLLVLPEK